jgi:XTP/dITP diphosphohydrolase
MIHTKPGIRIATTNAEKLAEFTRLFGQEFVVLGIEDLGFEMPPEHGDTFRENAVSKAISLARRSDLLTIADDSGLEVDALGGKPGVHTSRFAGPNASVSENVTKRFSLMKDVPLERRRARFVCVLALADSGGVVTVAEGRCKGSIAFNPAGSNGFGYDPIFTVADGRTMAELSNREKDLISHRARAVTGLLPELRSRVAALTMKQSSYDQRYRKTAS